MALPMISMIFVDVTNIILGTLALAKSLYQPGEPDLVFFDQSIDEKLNRSKLKIKKKDTPFLQNARTHKALATVKAVPPETQGLPRDASAPFVYEKWPGSFNERYFRKPRPIPKMIAAEFDRQAVLVERLRAEREIDDDDEDLASQFHEEDFDPLPEVAAFTVFIFVYSAIVGLDWQAYESKRLEEALKKANDDEAVSDEDEGRAMTPSQEVILSKNLSAKFIFTEPVDHDCGSCPKQSAAALSSTFSLFGEGAGEAYNRFFIETSNRMDEVMGMLDPSSAVEATPHKAILDTDVEEYEEAVEVANAQLDLGFEVLKSLSSRGLHSDLDAFKSMMQACGRCRNTEKALELTTLMKEHSLAPDSEILSVFVASFAADIEGDLDIAEFESPREDAEKRTSVGTLRPAPNSTTEPFPWLKIFEVDNGQSSDDSDSMESTGSKESSSSSFAFGGFSEWLGNARSSRLSKVKRRKRLKSKKMERSDSTRYRSVSKFVKTQVELGESLLDYLYPDLKIDTNSDACPHCSYSLSESETVLGWEPRNFYDYTTQCPKCKHRFVPNFSVWCSSPTFEGSQGKQTVLFCELLSPWVLRKALGYVINGETGILGMLEPEWRNGTDIRATLFWNLIVLCRRYRLPFGFLLQGSVQGRLILPRPPKEM